MKQNSKHKARGKIFWPIVRNSSDLVTVHCIWNGHWECSPYGYIANLKTWIMWNLIDLHPKISLRSLLGHCDLASHLRIVFLMFPWVFVAIVCFYRILNAKTFYKKNVRNRNRNRNTIHLIFDLTGHSRKKCPLFSIYAKMNAKYKFSIHVAFLSPISFFLFCCCCTMYIETLFVCTFHLPTHTEWTAEVEEAASERWGRVTWRERERARVEKNIRTKAVQTILIKDSLLLNDWIATTAAAPRRHKREENEEYDISNGFFCNSNTFHVDSGIEDERFRMVHQIVVHCDCILVILHWLWTRLILFRKICTMKGFYTPWIDHCDNKNEK